MASSRPEQIAAQRHLARQLVAALVSGDQLASDTAGRRIRLALVTSGVLAVLLFAGLSLAAAFRVAPPVDTSWRYEGAYVIERETGARFVLLADRLHPVLNYASVRLLVGRPNVRPESVARADLAGVATGETLGIPGAPDSLPEETAMLTQETVAVGELDAIPAGRGLVARSGRTYYLILAGGTKFPLVRGSTGDALLALGYAKVRPVAVPEDVLAAMPTGPALDPVAARANLE